MLREKMGGFRRMVEVLFCMSVCGDALPLSYTHGLEPGGAPFGSVRDSETSTVAAGHTATALIAEAIDKSHDLDLAEGEAAVNANHAQQKVTAPVQAERPKDSGATAGEACQNSNGGNGDLSVHRKENTQSPIDSKALTAAQSGEASRGAEATGTLQSFEEQGAKPSTRSPTPTIRFVRRMQLVRDIKRMEFAKALAAYATQLSKRALTAGQELIDLLKAAEELPAGKKGLLLKLFRTWPDVQELAKQYESCERQPEEQLISLLVQYRARATDLARRPRPRIYASRAIQAYLDIGDTILKNVIASFLSFIRRAEFERLKDFREFYLPMLQVSLSESALMLQQVSTKQSRVCLKIIERRIMQLEYIGDVARVVRRKWKKLDIPETDAIR